MHTYIREDFRWGALESCISIQPQSSWARPDFATQKQVESWDNSNLWWAGCFNLFNDWTAADRIRREDHWSLLKSSILQLAELKSRIWLHVLIGYRDGNWGRPLSTPQDLQLRDLASFDRRRPEATITQHERIGEIRAGTEQLTWRCHFCPRYLLKDSRLLEQLQIWSSCG